MKVLGLIPSRMGSTRLPAKALLPISGLPLVIHTYRRAKLSKLLDKVVICTDSKKILSSAKIEEIKDFGALNDSIYKITQN